MATQQRLIDPIRPDPTRSDPIRSDLIQSDLADCSHCGRACRVTSVCCAELVLVAFRSVGYLTASAGHR